MPQLLSDCAALLDRNSAFLVLTAYATHLSAISIAQLSEAALSGFGGRIGFGEMTIREAASGKLLPTSLFVRWDGRG